MKTTNNAKKIKEKVERQFGLKIGALPVSGLPTDKKELARRIVAAVELRKQKNKKKEPTVREVIEDLRLSVTELRDYVKSTNEALVGVTKSIGTFVEGINSTTPPAWYKHAPDKIALTNEIIKVDTGLKMPEQEPYPEFPTKMEMHTNQVLPVEIQNPTTEIKAEIVNFPEQKADTSVVETILFTFTEMVRFLTASFKKVFKVRLEADHYKTPQMVVLYDARTKKPANLEELGFGAISMSRIFSSGGGGPSSIAIRGANGVGDSTITLATAGTRQQLPDINCSRVYVQASMENVGEVVIGGDTVVASAGTRRGLMLSSTQWAEFKVDKLSRLWIDGTSTGDKITLVYES
jgi:hypothetical protein